MGGVTDVRHDPRVSSPACLSEGRYRMNQSDLDSYWLWWRILFHGLPDDSNPSAPEPEVEIPRLTVPPRNSSNGDLANGTG